MHRQIGYPYESTQNDLQMQDNRFSISFSHMGMLFTMALLLGILPGFGQGTIKTSSNLPKPPFKDTLLILHQESVFFPSNGDRLDENALQILQKVRDTLPKATNKIYEVQGHTDHKGSDAFNLDLSQRRARNVQSKLKELGIDSSTISINYFGKRKPKASNTNAKGMALNRRVDIFILKKFRLEMLFGNVASDSIGFSDSIKIKVISPIYEDSTYADSLGNFALFVPANQQIFLRVEAKEHLYAVQPLVATRELMKKKVELHIKSLQYGKKIAIPDLNFFGGSIILLPKSEPAMKALIATMQANPDVCFDIRGHVNHPGDLVFSGSSFELAEGRAQTVFEDLKCNRISASRMTHRGFSNFEMIYPKPKNEAEMSANRRVEIFRMPCKQE